MAPQRRGLLIPYVTRGNIYDIYELHRLIFQDVEWIVEGVAFVEYYLWIKRYVVTGPRKQYVLVFGAIPATIAYALERRIEWRLKGKKEQKMGSIKTY